MTQGFNILSYERKNRKGGGLACIYNERFKMKLLVLQDYESFKSLIWNSKSMTNLFSLFYRPLNYTKKGTPNKNFPR